MIRLAVGADAADIHQVLLEAFEPLRDRYTPGAFDATVLDLERARARLSEGPVWVAEVDGAIVGTFGVRVSDEGYYLRGMGVAPAARGHGVGRALVDAAVAFVEAQPPRRTWLYTTRFLEAAIHLYEAAGFERFDEDPPAQLHGTELVGMERPTASTIGPDATD